MTASVNQTLYLIDGSSYLYRAYHALPPLNNNHGEPTGAVFGVANMIRKMILEHKPDYIAVVFDAKGKNFRHELYTEYKSHRPPMPDDLRVQIEPLHKLITAMGIPLISIPGVEADDVIATLAKQAESRGWFTRISTIDKDMMQLVNPHIKIYNDMNKTEYDEKGVLEKFGVPSTKIVDYLSLIGDKSDNIPGVPGVGPKTAIKWLNDFDNLENLIANAHQITNKAGQALRDNAHYLPLSKQLVTLKTDVDLKIGISDLKKKPTNHSPLITLLEALSFKSWLNDELKNVHATSVNTDNNSVSTLNSPCRESESATLNKTTVIKTQEELQHCFDMLKASHTFAFDIPYINPPSDPKSYFKEAVALSFSLDTNSTNNSDNTNQHFYIDSKNFSLADVLGKTKTLFEDTTITKIGHNIKYLINILSSYHISLALPYHDTMLLSYVSNSTASKHDLNTLAYNILGYSMVKYEDIAGKGVKQINFNDIEINKAANYCIENTKTILQLYHYFYDLLKKDNKLLKLYTDIELPLAAVLAKIERNGVLIDASLLLKQSQEIEQSLVNLSNTIYKATDSIFNIDSPKQLQEILYQKLGLPALEKTPTGQPSTSEAVLQELALNFPIVTDILQYRSLKKIKSTYTDSLPLQIDKTSSRVHTCFQQAVTSTGRLSSTDPNLQNIPIKTAEGRRIRQAFIAAKDHSLISCDYSQVELRIMAHLSQDKTLLQAFTEEQDIHTFTAAEVLGIKKEDVTPEQRRYAKAINFGLIYGMSAFGLAKQLNIDSNAASQYIKSYFSRYPGVKDYMEDIVKIAAKQGYVETIFGRRLYLPQMQTKSFMQRKALERLAINAPMQGSAADIIKKAMIAVEQKLPNTANLILQVHDELIIEVHNNSLEITKNIVINAMQSAAKLSVPLKVSCHVGHNWDEAH